MAWWIHRWRAAFGILAAILVAGGLFAAWNTGASGEAMRPAAVAGTAGTSGKDTSPRPIQMLTLFWPPYTGEALPYGGESTRILRSVFEREGIPVEVGYVPWPRALTMFQQKQADILYPEYAERAGQDGCLLSQAYQVTSLSLVERRDMPLRWNLLSDLSSYTLGVVRGYINSPGVDALVRTHRLQVEADNNDTTNIRKVAAGRIDGAFIDPQVYRYLMEQDVSLQPLRDLVRLGGKSVALRTLHACFQDTERGRHLRDIFNRAITEQASGKQ
ncbi:substrate-binding periplasmic protein [Insolitispirillum peregrinum]|uniref:substrate-binding periplasmic protein n=1 Tax=Insolitispirillum peregrinum TaxID=80876 RepID=UPI0036188FD1